MTGEQYIHQLSQKYSYIEREQARVYEYMGKTGIRDAISITSGFSDKKTSLWVSPCKYRKMVKYG